MKIKIYGSGGTIPVAVAESAQRCVNTSCIAVTTGEHTLILDCGSGMAILGGEMEREMAEGKTISADILLSHLHLDHIIGLPAFTPIRESSNDMRLYTISRDARPLAEQVFGSFAPPYWPVAISSINRAEIVEIDGKTPFQPRKGVLVTPFALNHHDQTIGFRIDADKSLVYLLDSEISENMAEYSQVVQQCKDADLIVFDASYLPEDYEKRKGWGHSTYLDGLQLAKAAGCGKMIFCHMSYEYAGMPLEALEKQIENINERFFFAYDGMEMTL